MSSFEPTEDRSPVQSGLLNFLIARSGNKARVRHFRSAEWESLTFTGQRHTFNFVADYQAPLAAMIDGLQDTEVALPGSIVADIAPGPVLPCHNGQFAVEVEALTVED